MGLNRTDFLHVGHLKSKRKMIAIRERMVRESVKRNKNLLYEWLMSWMISPFMINNE